MSVKFVGGPLDGREFDAGQLAALTAVIPVPAGTGVRAFVAMPDPAACDRVLRGEALGDRGGTTVYEQAFLPGGGSEFRHATDEAFAEAVREGAESGDRGTGERRREFGELADRIAGQVRGGAIGAGTGVYLVYRYADREGNEHPHRVSVTPRAWARSAGRGEGAAVYEADVHRDAIVGTVHALVRAAPTGWLALPTHPDRELRVAGFDLEIVPPG